MTRRVGDAVRPGAARLPLHLHQPGPHGRLRALKVASGYQVTLYADDNFGGASLTMTADDSSLIDDDWNDKVSSLVVSKGTSTPGTLIQAEAYSSMSGVSTEDTSDSDGGSNVGYIDTADWLAYSGIQFPSSGTYRVEYRVASRVGIYAQVGGWNFNWFRITKI